MKPEKKSDGVISVLSFKSGRRSAVHDISHAVFEECQKLIAECSVLISKYHSNLMDFGSYSQDTLQFRNDIKTIRLQIFTKIKQTLDKMSPHMDQISKNIESEMYTSTQHLIGYLEFLKLEFNRNMYLLLAYPIETMNKSNIEFEFSDAFSSSLVAYSPVNGEATIHTVDPLTQHRNEIKSIRKDLKEIEVRIYYLSQKFTIDALGGHNELNGSGTLYKPNKKKKNTSISKLKLFCCFCSQTYL